MFKFKCAEDQGHVAKVAVSASDASGALEFFEHFNVPVFNKEQLMAAIDSGDSDAIHDACHGLLESLVTAYDNGHKAVIELESTIPGMMAEIRAKQEKCRAGTHA